MQWLAKLSVKYRGGDGGGNRTSFWLLHFSAHNQLLHSNLVWLPVQNSLLGKSELSGGFKTIKWATLTHCLLCCRVTLLQEYNVTRTLVKKSMAATLYFSWIISARQNVHFNMFEVLHLRVTFKQPPCYRCSYAEWVRALWHCQRLQPQQVIYHCMIECTL